MNIIIALLMFLFTDEGITAYEAAHQHASKAACDSSLYRDVNNQTRDIIYGSKDIPAGISYDGNVITSAAWEEGPLSNIVFITETEEKGGDVRSKELFGYQYVNDGSGWKQLWKIQDYVRDCEFDVTLNYIPGSLSITDLNSNGISESTFLYRLSCKSDVSPDDMKLMMHEGATKYAIRGSMNLVVNGQNYPEGDMKIDKSFNDAPDGFLDFARQQWNKYQTERLGE